MDSVGLPSQGIQVPPSVSIYIIKITQYISIHNPNTNVAIIFLFEKNINVESHDFLDEMRKKYYDQEVFPHPHSFIIYHHPEITTTPPVNENVLY